MKKYTHLMWDIETLDTGSEAVVLSVGAVAFNPSDDDTEESLGNISRCFYMTLSMQDQMDEGRTVSAATLKWWLKQDRKAQAVFHEVERSTITVLAQLHRFCVSHGTNYIWGNGNMFDNATMRSLYEDFEMACSYPVNFRSDLDLRTYKIAAGSPDMANRIKRIGTYHNALDDAKYQVLCAQYYNKVITG